MKKFHRWSVPRQVTGCVASRSKSGRTPATLCRSVNTVRVLGQPCEAKSRPLWPRATNESGSVADEPFATSRTSRRGGGFHLHVPRASWQPCAPVGRADVGAVFTFSCHGLAGNRALQLDEPTGGLTARKSVPSQKVNTVKTPASTVETVKTPAALCRSVNPVRRLESTWPNHDRPLWPCATGESASLLPDGIHVVCPNRPDIVAWSPYWIDFHATTCLIHKRKCNRFR